MQQTSNRVSNDQCQCDRMHDRLNKFTDHAKLNRPNIIWSILGTIAWIKKGHHVQFRETKICETRILNQIKSSWYVRFIKKYSLVDFLQIRLVQNGDPICCHRNFLSLIVLPYQHSTHLLRPEDGGGGVASGRTLQSDGASLASCHLPIGYWRVDYWRS